jgi:hypothetical protein
MAAVVAVSQEAEVVAALPSEAAVAEVSVAAVQRSVEVAFAVAPWAAASVAVATLPAALPLQVPERALWHHAPHSPDGP